VEGVSSADIMRTRGRKVRQMQVYVLFGSKNYVLFEIYGVLAQTMGEGLSQCGQGEVEPGSSQCE